MANRLFKLWGAGKATADDDKDPADDKENKADDTGEGKAEDKPEEGKAEGDKVEDDEAAKAELDDDEDEDEDDDDDEEEAAKAAAKVPAAAARYICRGERKRLHAIVDGAGPDRVEAALHVALNTNMSAKAALAFLKASPAAATSGDGKLGLRGVMGSRRQPPLAPAAGPSAKSAEDQAAAGILAFVTPRTSK
jgi:hypothetical protein